MSNNEKIDLKQALSERQEVHLLTSGTSMQPMLREHRDIVVIERVNRPLKRNDVPAYTVKPDMPYVLHRILKVTDKGYIIRGDNLFSKEFVTDSQIIGVLKAFYREGKYIDCAKSKKYKLYVAYIRLSYPAKKLWRFYIRPFLSKIKHTIIK